MAESYRPSQTKFYYGGSTFVVDLTAHIESMTAQGLTIIDRRQRITSLGELGTTADAISAGLSCNMSVRLHSDLDDVYANPEGILFVHRTDADDVTAFDCALVARQEAAPADGAVVMALAFMQLAAGDAVIGAQVIAGNVNPIGTQVAFLKTNAGITKPTISTAVGANVGVVGIPLEADNT